MNMATEWHISVHDDVMTWKRIMFYCPLWVEPTLLVDFPCEGPVMHGFGVFFVVNLNNLLKNGSVTDDMRRLNAHVTLQ